MDSVVEQNSPEVSIVMPVFNGVASVARALGSVADQSFRNYEFIVVDDGSTDNTARIVLAAASMDSRIVYEKNNVNRGIQFSLNRGLALARGKYIARIDADDQWVDFEKLAQQVRFLDENVDYVCVGTGAIVVNESGKEQFRFLKPLTDDEIRKIILGKNCFMHGSIVMRKDAVERAGGYDASPESRHVEDYDLWLRLGQFGKLANLPIFGLQYTVSASQISTKHKLVQFKKNRRLMRKYRDAYPGFFVANIRNFVRTVVYGYLNYEGLKRLTARWTIRRR